MLRAVFTTALSLAAMGLPGVSQRALPLGPMLHAHNCYVENGRWADRLDRALGTGQSPIAIEQDLAWAPDRRVPVVSHEGDALEGDEPSLETHFFDRMRPALDRALKDGRRDRWPLYVLHLDFKTNEPEHHAAVWALLGKYARYLTTAPRTAGGSIPQPFIAGPLLVITENGDGQAKAFHDDVAVGGSLRIFGTVPSAVRAAANDREAQLEAMFAAAPETLIPSPATNYRRWTNFPWAAVERGGQARAGAWTAADAARLAAIVSRARAMGVWTRFYTLNGHAAEDSRGWTESYNFGSLEAVKTRWRAARAAGVTFIATDQYEDYARTR